MLRHHHLKTGQSPGRGRSHHRAGADARQCRCDLGSLPARQTTGRACIATPWPTRSCSSIKGQGTLQSMFGVLPFKPFDYVVIPRCTTYRLDFDAGSSPDLLVIESSGNVGIPPRYLNPDGQMRLGAPYYERDLHGPTRTRRSSTAKRRRPVLIKDGSRLTRYTSGKPSVRRGRLGWFGLSVHVQRRRFRADHRHDPSAAADSSDVRGDRDSWSARSPRACWTRIPRRSRCRTRIPMSQADEVLYYVRGSFGSRRGVEEASFTLHPHGIPHGPHPGTIVASRPMTRTDELAVMVDTLRPLRRDQAGDGI